MTNTIPGVVTKTLVLIPIAAAVYFFDFPRWIAAFASLQLLSVFILCASLFALGVILKRRILRVTLELSETSVVWGLLLLAGSVLLFLYGSYSSDLPLFRYESLYLMVISYVAFRVGTRVLRTLAPLLAIFAFSYMPISLVPGASVSMFVIISYLVFAVLFFAFVRFKVRVMALPVSILLLGLLAWYRPVLSAIGHQVYSWYLVPLPLLVLAVPRVRNYTLLPVNQSDAACPQHHLFPDGFCSVCGRKLFSAKSPENFGLWGLLAVIFVGAALIFTSVPMLAFTGGVPYDAHYSTQGFSGAITPATPSGWQINSTTSSLYNESNTYAIEKVYVPAYHPEIKNYTMYYEVSAALPVSGAPQGDVPGWGTASNDFLGYGPFQGYLTTYVRQSSVMLVYAGKTQMMFLTDSGFKTQYVGVSFVRQFTNSNVSADKMQFLGDLNAIWLSKFTTDVSYSGWCVFLNTMYQDGVLVSPALLVASSSALIAWVAYRAGLSDQSLDRFLTLASTVAEENWSYLAKLLRSSDASGTGYELALSDERSGSIDPGKIDASLRTLERKHLVKRMLAERGSDLIMVWKGAL